jgi:hypothetical protein
MEQDKNLVQAAVYPVRQGKREQCEFHGENHNPEVWDLEEDFWRFAKADRNRGGRGPIALAADMDAPAFTVLLEAAYEDHAEDCCGYCAKNADH